MKERKKNKTKVAILSLVFISFIMPARHAAGKEAVVAKGSKALKAPVKKTMTEAEADACVRTASDKMKSFFNEVEKIVNAKESSAQTTEKLNALIETYSEQINPDTIKVINSLIEKDGAKAKNLIDTLEKDSSVKKALNEYNDAADKLYQYSAGLSSTDLLTDLSKDVVSKLQKVITVIRTSTQISDSTKAGITKTLTLQVEDLEKAQGDIVGKADILRSYSALSLKVILDTAALLMGGKMIQAALQGPTNLAVATSNIWGSFLWSTVKSGVSAAAFMMGFEDVKKAVVEPMVCAATGPENFNKRLVSEIDETLTPEYQKKQVKQALSNFIYGSTMSPFLTGAAGNTVKNLAQASFSSLFLVNSAKNTVVLGQETRNLREQSKILAGTEMGKELEIQASKRAAETVSASINVTTAALGALSLSKLSNKPKANSSEVKQTTATKKGSVKNIEAKANPALQKTPVIKEQPVAVYTKLQQLAKVDKRYYNSKTEIEKIADIQIKSDFFESENPHSYSKQFIDKEITVLRVFHKLRETINNEESIPQVKKAALEAMRTLSDRIGKIGLDEMRGGIPKSLKNALRDTIKKEYILPAQFRLLQQEYRLSHPQG